MGDVAMVLAVGALSYGLRVSFIAVLAGRSLSPGVERVLAQVKPAALTALAVTMVVSRGAVDPAHLVALGVAAAAAWLRSDVLLSLVAGMAVLLALTAIG